MDLKKFSVVHFVDENSYEVIPSTWITPDQTRGSFPSNKPKGLQKLQSTPDSPYNSAWPLWNIKIINYFWYLITNFLYTDKFERANKKAGSVVKGLETSDIEQVRKSRRNIPPQLPSEQIIEPDSNLGESAKLNNFLTSDQEEGRQHERREVHDNPQSLSEAPGSGQELFLQVHNPDVTQLQEEFRRFQEESLHNQAELLVRINDLTKLVKQVLSSTGTVPSPSTWPLRTLEDFKTVDELIKDPKNFAAEFKALTKIRGGSLLNHIYSTLGSIFAHELALQIRWTDASGKVQLQGSELARLVREAVKFTREEDQDATDKNINSIIAKWFRQSPDRKGGSGSRRNVSSDGNTEENHGEENTEEGAGVTSENQAGNLL
ncbi:uncharacterized protein LOC118437062 [Folsomia candida]|uniref:uncharacterized protein LOC118437062 n=1 Tax=Folsomia candida TaxID=158441 RepID=UPI001604BC42|nr:uncharacterized protein LOC118437062 [Folsomia candida]